MRPTPLFWRIYPPAALFMAAISAAAAWYSIPYPGHAAFSLYVIFGAAAALPMAAVIARMVGAELDKISQGLTRISIGGLSTKVESSGVLEIDRLAEKLNRIARELEERQDAGAYDTQCSDAILASMEEGALAVDADLTILKINPAARDILEIGTSRVEGTPLDGLISQRGLMKLIKKGVKDKTSAKEEIEFAGRREKTIRLDQHPLYNADGEYWGQALMIKDVTTLKRLENIRRDFAANVSHELRTPITSIQGFVETLKSGAMNDREKAEKFLGIIERHIKRLSAIIDDLLSLSRIESGPDGAGVSFKESSVRDILERAIDDMSWKAHEKKIEVRLDCPPDAAAPIIAPLLERAAVNLVDNAINASDEGATVWVSAHRKGSTLSIHVRDQGCGMEKVHLKSIFQRFYRVDNGRARKDGGSGLGLSIVKRVAMAHGGKVSVDSVPGEGSVFSIHLPLNPSGRAEKEA